ncbi:tetratricopeptide repeat-containing sensor histidine kinase [Algoriphagus aquimarinus]|uniref:histidine kinase n=1 Tax=Algoriphagus aquimarinus TaxID=237018 RepID=A0A1I1C6K3_9BACT|nr:tetratricopeptide repeat-containing sensor histidine kinase [Algoriphagus aquimarinus]SFB58244.1 Tetratricopeptide repeat-containing protein [Algoriphagus aquimarinus]
MNRFLTINKYFFLLLISFSLLNESEAQTSRADSLLSSIRESKDDSLKVNQYLDLGLELLGSEITEAIQYIDKGIQLSTEINYKKGLADGYNAKGRAYSQLGDFQEAILSFQEALKFFREIQDETGEANILSNLGSIYFKMGNNTKALELHFESLKISEQLDNKLRIGTSLNNIGTVYSSNPNTINEALTNFKKSLEVFEEIDMEIGMAITAMNIGEVYFMESKYDSATYYHEVALAFCDGTIDATFPLTQLGEINSILGNFPKAYEFHNRAIEISEKSEAKFELTQSLIGMAKTQKLQQNFEGAIRSLEKAEILAIETDAKKELVEIYQNMAESHAQIGDYRAAYENELNVKSVKENIAKTSTEKMIQQLQFEFQLDKKEAEIEILQKDTELKNAAVFNQKIIIIASLVALIMFVIISIYLYRNNLGKQKANRLLQFQKEEIRSQREIAESAYDKLLSTQALLIQSEKMASLGELTAGIAHEIQNPLNFVNNFSELSAELVEEMNEELENGDLEEAKAIGKDLKANLFKINSHGKRADAIVKGMLEHSRTNKGEKAPTDLNALLDEFVRLSYHGLRAKKKSFNSDFKLDLDPQLQKASVVASDIGRVILNLVNNAFYAVDVKAKSAPDSNRAEGFKPMVIISSKRIENRVEISVKDNGNGIPDSVKDKIFQPFFTTKPAGSGTGLGLSLSYDIVKAHGGHIEVNSTEGLGSEFTITLPI